MISFFHKPDSPIGRNYLEQANNRLPGKTPLEGVRFVALDTETSGLNIGTDRILSIALFEIINGKIDLALSRKWLVYQPESMPTRATAIHGILPRETQGGTPEKEVLEELIPLLSGAILIGHHIRFDANMLNEAMIRHFKTKFRNRIVDTAHMAMRELIPFHQTGYANQRPPTLDEVCSQLDLPLITRHTAEGDAFLAAEIFLFLCGKIHRRIDRPLQTRDLPIRKY